MKKLIIFLFFPVVLFAADQQAESLKKRYCTINSQEKMLEKGSVTPEEQRKFREKKLELSEDGLYLFKRLRKCCSERVPTPTTLDDLVERIEVMLKVSAQE
ncbi:MAG: hypothetical protein ACJAZS_000762 [Alteromonas naphthalenivorans]|jgi:hypothetical protein